MAMRIKRRIGAGAPTGTDLVEGQLAYHKVPGTSDNLYIGDGTAAVPLVSAARQVETNGAQTINGAKTFSTEITLPIAYPSKPEAASNKAYVDHAVAEVITSGGAVPEAPKDQIPAIYYGRGNEDWQPVLPLAGGTIESASNGTPLLIKTTGGLNSIASHIRFENPGGAIPSQPGAWEVGPGNGGGFQIIDANTTLSPPMARLTIDQATGTVNIVRDFHVTGNAVFDGTITGNIDDGTY